jgi:hypothetical protein
MTVKQVFQRVVAVAALASLVLLVIFWSFTLHWLAVHTGVSANNNVVYYNFWSGFGSDLGEATLIATLGVGVYTGFRKVNCHAKGCPRIGHHPLEGTPYHLCSRHHPDVPSGGATHAEILEHHRQVVASRDDTDSAAV